MKNRSKVDARPSLSRREFLGTSGALLSAAALPSWVSAPALTGKTRHVVLIAFAGGVRSRDTIGTPRNVPNLMRLAERGCVFPNVGVENLGHYGATLSIFTGIPEYMGIRESARSFNPTVFEYVRRDLDLPASSCWLSSNNGSQAVNFAYGLHPDFGPRFGANVIDGDSLFNEEFRETLSQFGKPRADAEDEFEALSSLRAGLTPAPGHGLNDAETAGRVEKYILEELTSSQTTRLTGPGAADAKALAVAGRVLQLFRPRLLGVSLANADIAHGSFNAYTDVIRRNDQQIGAMLDIIESDANLRDSTAIFVLPEFGRDRDLNQRNGLDHGDGSDDLQKVACIAYGPDFRAGRTISSGVRSIDICPTICKLFGSKPKLARGKVLPGLFA